jgi:hypothetical protein
MSSRFVDSTVRVTASRRETGAGRPFTVNLGDITTYILLVSN